MRLVCAWCGRTLKKGDSGRQESHGICPPCAARVMAKLGKKNCVEISRIPSVSVEDEVNQDFPEKGKK